MSAAPGELIRALLGVAVTTLLTGGFLAMVLLHHRRMRLAQRTQEQMRGRLLEAARAGRLVLWSAEGHQLLLDEAAEDLLGTRPADLEGLVALVDAEAQPVLRVALTAGEGRVRAPLEGGRITEWLFDSREGRLEGVIRDITEAERLQTQLLQSQKLEAIGTLVSGISHEFGNLLMGVEACVEGLVADANLPPDHATAARLIQDSALRGRSLIRELLAFGRRDPGQPESLVPARLLADAEALLRPLLGRKVRVDLEVAPGLPTFRGDRAQLLQALVNLCLNARDAGAGTLRLGARWGRGRTLVFCVADDGPGMSPEVQARAFEPFFTTKPAGQGSGLGIPVTQGIAERHGGALSCHSEPGQGTTFFLQLPVVEPDPADPVA